MTTPGALDRVPGIGHVERASTVAAGNVIGHGLLVLGCRSRSRDPRGVIGGERVGGAGAGVSGGGAGRV